MRVRDQEHWWQSPQSRGAIYAGELLPDRLVYGWPAPPCRTLVDMSEDEIAELEREYGAPVIRPATNRGARGRRTRASRRA